MLLALASIADQYVTAGVAHWRAQGHDAEIVTCHDLAQPGWQLTLDGEPTLVVAGKRVRTRDVRGVVTRLAGVTAFELPFIHIDDRDYAAAEMQAFLLALLTQLEHHGVMVMNSASPGSLCGPPWSAEQWTQCAARAGAAVRPVVRRAYAGGATAPAAPAGERAVVHVVGDDAFGDAPAAAVQAAVAIAAAAHTPLLRVAFDARATPPVFLDADVWVDVSRPEIAEAIGKRVSP